MATTSKAVVEGHFGELLQGRVGPRGDVALITLPCPQMTCTVLRRPGPVGLFQPGRRVLAPGALQALMAALDLPLAGRHVLRLSMPVGAGAGASTAARVAIARAAGQRDAWAIARACLATEGASDPLMFPEPGRLLWASRQGRVLARLPPLPRFEVLGGFLGAGQRTDPRDRRFPDVTDLVADWQSAPPDLARLGRLASLSAARCLALRGPAGDPTAGLARRLGALGWMTAHTGSARGLIFAPGGVPAGAADSLRCAGFSGITRFMGGG